MQTAIDEIGLDWIVQVRNGDTDPKIKAQQTRSMPDVLLVTPKACTYCLLKNNATNILRICDV
jgi:Lhr-like helicase